jgi:hypothetical protein
MASEPIRDLLTPKNLAFVDGVKTLRFAGGSWNV